MTLRSAVYEGWVRHRRYAPRPHAFRYRMAQPLLELSEIDEICRLHPLFSSERANIASFRRGDHAGDPDLAQLWRARAESSK